MENSIDFKSIFSAVDLGATAMDAPLRVLADWYLSDCEGKNLQPGTLEFYRCRIRFLVDQLGERRAGEVSTGHLRVLLAHLKETRQWSPQNANHCVQVWKGFFNYLESEGVIDQNPTRRLNKLRQESRFPKPFTAGEVGRLLQATGKGFHSLRDRTMMLVLLDTGVRVGELTGLAVEDVDLAHGVLRVFGKGRKERFVPFESIVRRALSQYLAVRAGLVRKTRSLEQALWLVEAGTPMKEDTFQFNLRTYGSRAGVEKVHAHRFRHTFATEFLKNGGSPQMLQCILGHTTPLMVQRYVHISDTDAKENHRKASPVEAWNGRMRR